MKKATYLTVLVASMAASPAFAQTYFGGALGSSAASLSTIVIPGSTASMSTKTETDSGVKFLVGYKIRPNFALEGGYVNLGKFSSTTNMTAPTVGSEKSETKSSGWSMMAVSFINLTPSFAAFGKAGGYYGTTTVDLSTSGTVVLSPGVAVSNSKSAFSLAYGIGIQYDITKAISVRAEIERFPDLDAGYGGKFDAGLTSVGVVFRY
jgi:OOP family OmpA-OmpF porin